MRQALLLTFYLGDQLLSGLLPFSSGPFSIAAVLLCWRHSIVTAKMLRRALIAIAILLMAGSLGAWLSFTPVSAFFVATTLMVTLLWIIGAGLRPGTDLLITPRLAFIGVAIATSFMMLSLLGWDAQAIALKFPINRGAGLFTEPSHYALFVMPLWLIAHEEQKYRPTLYAAMIFTFVTCFSATLVAFWAITMCLSLFLVNAEPDRRSLGFARRLIVIATIAILCYYVTIPVNVEGIQLHTYIGNRINGIVNAADPVASNLSSLVVLQGVELAQISLVESRGFGVGLGNLGLSEQIVNQSEFKALINAVTANSLDLNLRDGGLMANKLVGELGLFCLLIPIALGFYLARVLKLPDARSRNYHAAFAATLICLLFVRVLPYFSGPACLALFSIAGVLQSHRAATALRSNPKRLHRLKRPAELAPSPKAISAFRR